MLSFQVHSNTSKPSLQRSNPQSINYPSQQYQNYIPQIMQKTGRKKIGKYIVDLGDILGSGSSAKVYHGTNNENNEQVAVKVIDKTQIQSDQYMKNAFYQEIRIMMKLKSPNIIGFYDVNETKSNFYLILEIANKGSLRTILNEKKGKKEQLTEKQTIKYLVQLLNGFGAMLKFGVIHRDIKPENIFVKDDKLKIGDFGFAKNNQKLDSMMSTIVGSPAYMAPQILKKEKYSYKCDIWSLGVMTYEMLVGELPFDYKKVSFSEDKNFDKDRKEIYKTVVNTQIKYPAHIKISEEMDNFIKGCLQIREQDRFDWHQLFNHAIFKGIFKANFENMKKGQQLLAYITGAFRMIFNQYNVDIIEELTKLNKPTMGIDEFKDFLQYLNCDIYAEESQVLVEVLKKDNLIRLKDFEKLMQIHECLPTVKPLSNESILIADVKKLSLAINLIKKVNKSKPINTNQLIPKEIMLKEKLDLADFSKIIKSLIPQVPDHVLPEFKKHIFNSSEGELIPIKEFVSVIEDMLKDNEETQE